MSDFGKKFLEEMIKYIKNMTSEEYEELCERASKMDLPIGHMWYIDKDGKPTPYDFGGRGRQWRRYQSTKHKERVKKWLKDRMGHIDPKLWEEIIGIRSKTKANCSCGGCGNPRHSPFYKGEQSLDMRERKNRQELEEQFDEYLEDKEKENE